MLPAVTDNNLVQIMIITGILVTLLTIIYAWKKLKKNKIYFVMLTIIYLVSFIIVIGTDKWIVFLGGWEFVTLTTSLMFAWDDWKLVKQYFLIQFAGSSILLYAVLVIINNGYAEVGIINSTFLQNILIVGLATKSALFGFHFWLPAIYANSSGLVNAISSGWVVKLGYIILLKVIIPEQGNALLFYAGILMLIYGGVKALLEVKLKVLMAYSTLSQLGLIAIGIGSGTVYGYYGAVLHIIIHALTKTGFFINLDDIINKSGTQNIYELAARFNYSLFKIITIFGFSFSLSGVVFLAGFNSKYLIKNSLPGPLLLIIFYLGGLLTFLYTLRLLYWLFIFQGKQKAFLLRLNNYKINFSIDLFINIPILLIILLLGNYPDLLNYWLPALDSFSFPLGSGIGETILYLLVAYLILEKLNWVRTKEKEYLEIDVLFNKIEVLLNKIGKASLKFDTEKIVEHYFLRGIYKLSGKTHDFIYRSFSDQLSWIPLFLALLLAWRYLV